MIAQLISFALIQAILGSCPIDSSANLAVNGDFQQPIISGDYQYFYGSFLGWEGDNLEIGRGLYYTSEITTQAIEMAVQTSTFPETYKKV